VVFKEYSRLRRIVHAVQQATDQGAGLARVPALDLLRLVAVFGVIFFHYGFRGPTAFNVTHVALPELAWIGRYGFLGVPVFFVISGFMIAYSAEGRTATTFAIARFSRIYPCFLFCMTLTFSALLALARRISRRLSRNGRPIFLLPQRHCVSPTWIAHTGRWSWKSRFTDGSRPFWRQRCFRAAWTRLF
jgi:peptidoglycan/LPS O-acetylase OafA/YrhL